MEIVFNKGTRFLVTGGAGFIGSNLCEAILDMGHNVRCIDNFSTGYAKNIERFFGNPKFELYKADIRDFDACMMACTDIDYVLHQAAWGSVPRSIEQPLVYEDINTRGTLNMLEAARQSGVKKFVYASSSAVYGDSKELPKREEKTGTVLSPYAQTKKACEEYAGLYTRLYKLDTYGLRYFNVFGKNQDLNGPYAAVIPKFVAQLLQDTAPTIYGDGLQSRDFTYVKNVVNANLLACKADSEAAGQAYNIGCGGQEYIVDLYWKICKILGKHIEPEFLPDRRGDIRHSNADISKAEEILGYVPEYSFDEGIKHTVEWYRNNE